MKGMAANVENLGTLERRVSMSVPVADIEKQVNERLKVLFGNDYRMYIDSQPGRGTRIEIEVPELQTNLAAVS